MAKHKSSKSNSRRNKKIYNMKGCSKTRKNYLGGSLENSDANRFSQYNQIKKGGCGCSNVMPSNVAPMTGGRKLGGGCGPECSMGFMVGGVRHRSACKCSNCKKKTMKGGTLSNFIGQDLINLGRQFQFGLGTAYNALAGQASPVNPLPWKDQLTNSKPLNLVV
jgi:hypothetical protein